jgi:DNA-binding ferritin-like protein (Dps family)
MLNITNEPMSDTISIYRDILNLVLKAMVSMEQVSKLTGDDKKLYVISLLERQLPNYDEYKDIIPVIIELVIVLSRQKIPINIKKLEGCCFA